MPRYYVRNTHPLPQLFKVATLQRAVGMFGGLSYDLAVTTVYHYVYARYPQLAELEAKSQYAGGTFLFCNDFAGQFEESYLQVHLQLPASSVLGRH